MADKVLTKEQRDKAVKEISESVERNLRWQITELETDHDYAWLTNLQENILTAIADAVTPHVKGAIKEWEGKIERQENEKLKKLEAEVKDLRKYKAIARLIEEAKNDN